MVGGGSVSVSSRLFMMCRSGKLTYKPQNKVVCCPAYAIRCDVPNFKISRAQKRVLRDVAAFLNTGERPKQKAKPKSICNATGDHPDLRHVATRSKGVEPQASGDTLAPAKDFNAKNHQRSGSSKRRRWAILQQKMAIRAAEKGVSLEVIKKDYFARRETRLAKNRPKPLEWYLDLVLPKSQAKHFIEVRLCRSTPRSDDFNQTYDDEYALFYAYQTVIHNDDPSEISNRSFNRFLVESPLVSEKDPQIEAGGAPDFGSYHQQYWLDGVKLIAVGVIDILPGCLSSVYLFYDPEYTFLHLGTYTALREIAFVRQLHRTYGHAIQAYSDFTQYYMGYYIHSCVKMRYKAAFSPSYLACPETYQWVPVEVCRKLLDANKYSRFWGAGVAASHPKHLLDNVYANTPILLPNRSDIGKRLPSGKFTVVGDKIVTKLGVAGRILTKKAQSNVEEWLCLIDGKTGTMRINFAG